MDKRHDKPGGQQRTEEPREQQDKPRQEQEQRPKDLDPKQQGKEVKGGMRRWSDERLKTRVRAL